MANSTHLSRIDDRMIRLIGIPGFGISIPNFTGLFGPLTYTDWMYWLGYVYFIFIAFCIWQGNRWLLFKQRENMNWFSNPIRKLTLLVAANVFYTAPVTVVLIYFWYVLSGIGPVDWTVVQLVTLANVICVIFVTHAYETVFLIKERQEDQLAFEKLERVKIESELEALKSQIDPHFMFNSLNTLSYLIENDQQGALMFNENLSEVYRYILMNKAKEYVTLQQEIAFANNYYLLMRIRFGEGLNFSVKVEEDTSDKLLSPISLQLLLENAVKHNEFSLEHPLNIDLSLVDGHIEVVNNLQLKRARNSSKIGLRNLSERYRLLMDREVRIQRTADTFSVSIPYLTV